MTIKRILAFGTYPIVKPVHGGQRRIAAFKQFYRSMNIEYIYSCVYSPLDYGRRLVTENDIKLTPSVHEFAEVAASFVGDVLAGIQAARDEKSYLHFKSLVEKVVPDALGLEHPFMWPLVERLREREGLQKIPIIYSSHNFEPDLKEQILKLVNVPRLMRRKIYEYVRTIEEQTCRAAALVSCVSTRDRDCYASWVADGRLAVVPNGVDRPPPFVRDYKHVGEIFGKNRFVYVVGSAYPPNVEGFVRLVADNGLYFCPPVKSLAICGGVCDGIFGHQEFQRFLSGNSSRSQFFANIEDEDLWAIKKACHGAILPILTGGGSNLKTAEALGLGKWVVATSVALRGFEAFADAEGVLRADDSKAFRNAITRVLRSEPLGVSDTSMRARESLYWDRCFSDSALPSLINELGRREVSTRGVIVPHSS